tara:strand:+ start:294 stop:479 length:186 start_codon:yes stop_codon:yes gene_type:complete
MYIGTIKLPIIEEREENLNIKYVISQVIINIKDAIGLIITSIPTYVATPFPPLNFNQIGNT